MTFFKEKSNYGHTACDFSLCSKWHLFFRYTWKIFFAIHTPKMCNEQNHSQTTIQNFYICVRLYCEINHYLRNMATPIFSLQSIFHLLQKIPWSKFSSYSLLHFAFFPNCLLKTTTWRILPLALAVVHSMIRVAQPQIMETIKTSPWRFAQPLQGSKFILHLPLFKPKQDLTSLLYTTVPIRFRL